MNRRGRCGAISPSLPLTRAPPQGFQKQAPCPCEGFARLPIFQKTPSKCSIKLFQLAQGEIKLHIFFSKHMKTSFRNRKYRSRWNIFYSSWSLLNWLFRGSSSKITETLILLGVRSRNSMSLVSFALAIKMKAAFAGPRGFSWSKPPPPTPSRTLGGSAQWHLAGQQPRAVPLHHPALHPSGSRWPWPVDGHGGICGMNVRRLKPLVDLFWVHLWRFSNGSEWILAF